MPDSEQTPPVQVNIAAPEPSIAYTVRGMLERIDGKLDRLDEKVDTKADLSAAALVAHQRDDAVAIEKVDKRLRRLERGLAAASAVGGAALAMLTSTHVH